MTEKPIDTLVGLHKNQDDVFRLLLVTFLANNKTVRGVAA